MIGVLYSFLYYNLCNHKVFSEQNKLTVKNKKNICGEKHLYLDRHMHIVGILRKNFYGCIKNILVLASENSLKKHICCLMKATSFHTIVIGIFASKN